MCNNSEKEDNILRIQLSELNARTRWYGSHLWHVPFAYLGLSAAFLVGLSDRCPSQLRLGFIIAAIFGILVFVHLLFIVERELRAVRALINVEEKLGVTETAKCRWWYNIPFLLSVIGAVLFYIYMACV